MTPGSTNLLFADDVGGYQVKNSLRFRAASSVDLSRTPSIASNRKTWTWSGWVKRGALADGYIFGTNFSGSGGLHSIRWAPDTLSMYLETNYGSFVKTGWITNSVFRDPSAWYHIVFAFDTTQSAIIDMCKIYVNGVQQSTYIYNYNSTYISQNADGLINGTTFHTIGSGRTFYSYYFDGYMAEVNFVNGQALTPSSFGAYNIKTGVWQPTPYTGTYGTNGFYLKFASTGSTAALGTDSSGNGNTWTVNNISVTAGVTYDPMLDSPTLTSATVANFAVINPLSSIAFPITNGNLSIGASTTSNRCTKSTFAVSSGKWYWEFKASSMSASGQIAGICSVDATFSGGVVATGYEVGYYSNNGNKYVNGTASAYGASWTTANTIGVALDVGAGTVTFYKDNVSQGSISITAGQTWVASWTGQNTTDGVDYTFGQRPFAYTPPSGFVALNAYNLPTPTIANGATVMAATTYTGTGASLNVLNSNNTTTAVSFKPDMVWVKYRNAAAGHEIIDSVRGATNTIYPNLTSAENSVSSVTAFNSNGFTVGTDTGANTSGGSFIGWQWQAGQGSSSTNTAGSITSTVSVNAAAGFSVVTYTGTGANATVGHGLGVAPSMFVIKIRSAGAYNWVVYHASLGPTLYLLLDTTAGGAISSVPYNNTAPTSSVFSLGNGGSTNVSSATTVAYCWAAVAGYSAFGNYTGNGSSDGPFVYCGFRPRFILIKQSSAASNWFMWDTSRDTFNVIGDVLYASSASAELTGYYIDSLSNGFKLRVGGGYGYNENGNTNIYAAFAENPFKYALAR